MSDNYYKALGEIVKLTHENTALREELAETKSRSTNFARSFNNQCRKTDDLYQRLTDAEQREVELVELIREAFEAGDLDVFGMDLADRLEATIKSAESGARHTATRIDQ